MKKSFLLVLLAVLGLSACKTNVSILGDSYSTFGGYVQPDTNFVWYGEPNSVPRNNVTQAWEMWWYPIVTQKGYKLEVNNSFSGSTVCNTGYRAEDYSDRSFITRLTKLGKPDVILVFGGTNDSWAKAPIGEFKYEDWNDEELYTFRPAFAYLLHGLQKKYPRAKIYNITNSELSEEVTSSMVEICAHYNVPNIQLQDVNKQAGHPSVDGMKSISEQVLEKLNEAK
ncbi:MAG: SGNH/GDSL hydrolase family protein [Mangrovibacterium sp.]